MNRRSEVLLGIFRDADQEIFAAQLEEDRLRRWSRDRPGLLTFLARRWPWTEWRNTVGPRGPSKSSGRQPGYLYAAGQERSATHSDSPQMCLIADNHEGLHSRIRAEPPCERDNLRESAEAHCLSMFYVTFFSLKHNKDVAS